MQHRVVPSLSSLEAVFVDRDGVINQEPGPILSPDQLLFIPGSLEAILRINRMGKYCIGVSNQAAFARGLLSREVFEEICLKLEKALEKIGASLDDFFYCPHYPHWEEGWIKELCYPCQCRKPGTLLFEQAAKKYGLELQKTVFIGDATTDFEAAKRIGMFSIGVRTGHGGKDQKCDTEPDQWAEDLNKAVLSLLGQ
ncbi:MAG: HAD-IIIA family hydrolase [SAR324 cluster bacterium]|nr:HAD-IIIA family hydrolase [SAR324 cluster bacterium]